MGNSQIDSNNSVSLNSQEIISQVICVNELLKGVCCRLSASELNKVEGRGLYHLLDWQNEKLKQVAIELDLQRGD